MRPSCHYERTLELHSANCAMKQLISVWMVSCWSCSWALSTSEQAGRDLGETSEEPERDLGGTSEEPQRDLGGTSEEPQRDLGGTQEGPQRDLGGTSEGPQRDPGGTSEEPGRNLWGTSEEPGMMRAIIAFYKGMRLKLLCKQALKLCPENRPT